MPDCITIRKLKVNCIIGCNPQERIHKQDIFLTVSVQFDCRKAGLSDNLADTLNYGTLARDIRTFTEASSFQLIETLAQNIADLCLKYPGVQSVTVTIDKPSAIPDADAASLQITRP